MLYNFNRSSQPMQMIQYNEDTPWYNGLGFHFLISDQIGWVNPRGKFSGVYDFDIEERWRSNLRITFEPIGE